MERPSRPRALIFPIVALLGLIGFLCLYAFRARQRPGEAPAVAADRALPAPAGTRPRLGVATPKTAKPATVRCTSAAEIRCYRGDVWAFDSCERAEEKLDECDARACEDASCAPEPDEPCNEPNEGRCVGATVSLCLAGALKRIDCARRGLVCVDGAEGAECRAPRKPEEVCPPTPFCEGEVLVGCHAGMATRTACSVFNARCGSFRKGEIPRCIETIPNLRVDACGPCGCLQTGGEARCDGIDEDRDGVIDEGADCGPVPVVAFVVGDDNGNTSHAPEDITDELARVNALFASGGTANPPRFVLDQTVNWHDARLQEIDEDELNALANAKEVHALLDHFFVPIVFTDSVVTAGAVPKAGLSTLPNGMCGGMQVGTGPDVGVVVVAKGRSQTTLAHELGHFFGLCHTHEQTSRAQRAYTDANGALAGCSPSCAGDGDGICDTPTDPGTNACSVDATCEPVCADGAAAPVQNVMSYYTPCRRLFSPEQLALVQHTLALRRAWQPCFRDEGCPCTPGDGSCPSGMGCRPKGTGGRCELAGVLPPGAPCQQTRECAAQALCVTEETARRSQCARICTESGPACACVGVSDDLSICSDDLKPR